MNADSDYSPAKIYKALRTQALNLTAAQVGANEGAYGWSREVMFRAAVDPTMEAAGKTSCFARPGT
jgi:hypothetical protein